MKVGDKVFLNGRIDFDDDINLTTMEIKEISSDFGSLFYTFYETVNGYYCDEIVKDNKLNRKLYKKPIDTTN